MSIKQALYFWMWAKQKHDLSSHLSSSYDTWEELAFAEDTSATWPPRSYTCSFCRREFRSAQALGGHMNVHRRDRARLKQLSPNPQNHDDHQNLHKSIQNPSITTLGLQYPVHQVSNPNPKIDTSILASVPSTCSHFYSNSSFIDEHQVSKLKITEGKKLSRRTEGSKAKDDSMITTINLPERLNLVSGRADQAMSDSKMEGISCCKRRRTDEPSVPLFLKSSRDHESDEVYGVKAASIDDLDLELRLGCT